ncbi:MAG TPA: hypothetical protein VI612_01935 [Candidatus Nanoarchaeia archaeon]|nr:hypothetical protein [Candidatus Nanoarchaeia archaeon]
MNSGKNISDIITNSIPWTYDAEVTQLRPVLRKYAREIGMDLASGYICTILLTVMDMAISRGLDDAEVFRKTVAFLRRSYRNQVAPVFDREERSEIVCGILSEIERKLLQLNPAGLEQ